MWTAHRQPTFSLVEVIVVVAILAILATMAIPRYGQASAHYRADFAAGRVIADLDLARRHAHEASVNQLVSFDVSNDCYRLNGMPDPDHPGQEYVVYLSAEPYGARLLSADFSGQAKLTFNAYGIPNCGGTIVISVGDWKMTIGVSPDTGGACLP
jgi:prepilin-type N-terminal cleavage/methylation domain-containing protein